MEKVERDIFREEIYFGERVLRLSSPERNPCPCLSLLCKSVENTTKNDKIFCLKYVILVYAEFLRERSMALWQEKSSSQAVKGA